MTKERREREREREKQSSIRGSSIALVNLLNIYFGQQIEFIQHQV
jgi:hypothetical protein